MEDLKRVLPVFPKSIEEHDREVNETWRSENHSSILNDLCAVPTQTALLNELGIVLSRYYQRSSDNWSLMFNRHILVIEFKLNGSTEMLLRRDENFSLSLILNGETSEEWIYQYFEGARDKMLDLVAYYAKGVTKSEYSCKYCCDGDRQECGLEKTPIADIEVYIDENNELSMLVTNAADLTIIRTTMKIKHCPMCGRLLDNQHEQDNLKPLMKETMLNGLPEDLADAILNGDDRAVAEKVDKYKGGE